MTCSEFQRQWPAQTSLPELEAHLEQCEICCDALMAAQADLSAELDSWTVAEPPRDLVARTVSQWQGALPAESFWQRWLRNIDAALGRFGSHKPTGLTGFVTVTVAVLLLAKVLSPNMLRGRSSGQHVACARNCRALGEALRHYAADHHGKYPLQLSDLRPHYVSRIPDCPEVGRDTYSANYRVATDRLQFTLTCPESQ